MMTQTDFHGAGQVQILVSFGLFSEAQNQLGCDPVTLRSSTLFPNGNAGIPPCCSCTYEPVGRLEPEKAVWCQY